MFTSLAPKQEKKQPKQAVATDAVGHTTSEGQDLAATPRVPIFLQAKLAIGQPDDPYEKEADRVSDQIMRMREPAVQRACVADALPQCEGVSGAPPLFLQRAAPRLQRKCACGGEAGATGECEQCRDARLTVQRKPVVSGAIPDVPDLVDDVLRSSGEPVAPGIRAFFEPRFRHDFGTMRVHADARAAESAVAINALAYTVGSHVVFGHGQYQPHSGRGQRLLAHEMTHVIQQGGVEAGAGRLGGHSSSTGRYAKAVAGSPPQKQPSQIIASASAFSIQRTVGSTNCVSGTHGAPADPTAELNTADARASALAQAAANLSFIGSAAASIGVDVLSTGVGRAFQARFGLPPAVAGGFRNRFTGTVRTTRDEALSEELERLGNRLQSISNLYAGAVTYRCIGGATTFASCATHCTGRDASACHEIRVIFLCPSFWALAESARATVLIHEGAHVRFGNPAHSVSGLRHNFRHPECIASYVSDIFGLATGTPACPAP